MPRIPEDLTGRVFGRLTVLRFGERLSNKIVFICQCNCNGKNIISVRADNLRRGTSKSCGCYQKSVVATTNKTHGKRRHKIYSVWCGMLSRCNNKKNIGYSRYGGRGIKVCERWHIFENFFKDMGNPPTIEHQLDRFPDNNGAYSPENCRWASRKENSNNRRNNHILEFNNTCLTVTQWSERLNIPIKTLFSRIRRGWNIEKTLTAPVKRK